MRLGQSRKRWDDIDYFLYNFTTRPNQQSACSLNSKIWSKIPYLELTALNLLVCKYLNCQKLSQEACIVAVQNELMSLRLIVQALFVQQLNTHQAFKECSDSFRFTWQFSGILSSTRCPNSRSLNLGERPYKDGAETDGMNLSACCYKMTLQWRGIMIY